MLKKHPIVVETMKRLRRYVGNTKNWGYTDEQKREFDEKAGKVRVLAEGIYNSFKVSCCFACGRFLRNLSSNMKPYV